VHVFYFQDSRIGIEQHNPQFDLRYQFANLRRVVFRLHSQKKMSNRTNITVQQQEGDKSWKLVFAGGHKIIMAPKSPFNAFTHHGMPMDVMYSWLQKIVRSNWDESHAYYVLSQIWKLYLVGGKGHMSRALNRLITMLSEDLGAASPLLTSWAYKVIMECKVRVDENDHDESLFNCIFGVLVTMAKAPCSGLAGTLNNVFIDMLSPPVLGKYRGVLTMPGAQQQPITALMAALREALVSKDLELTAAVLGDIYWREGESPDKYCNTRKPAYAAWVAIEQAVNYILLTRGDGIPYILRKNIRDLRVMFKARYDGRRERLHVTHAAILVAMRDTITIPPLAPSSYTAQQMSTFKEAHSALRTIPDKVLDKHTRFGRAMNRSDEYFYEVSRGYWHIPEHLLFPEYERMALVSKQGMRKLGVIGARMKSGRITVGSKYIDRYGTKVGDVSRKRKAGHKATLVAKKRKVIEV
jgi:hypothetical protein